MCVSDILPFSFDLSGTDSALYPYDPEQGYFKNFWFPTTNLYPYFLFPPTTRPRLSSQHGHGHGHSTGTAHSVGTFTYRTHQARTSTGGTAAVGQHASSSPSSEVGAGAGTLTGNGISTVQVHHRPPHQHQHQHHRVTVHALDLDLNGTFKYPGFPIHQGERPHYLLYAIYYALFSAVHPCLVVCTPHATHRTPRRSSFSPPCMSALDMYKTFR